MGVMVRLLVATHTTRFAIALPSGEGDVKNYSYEFVLNRTRAVFKQSQLCLNKTRAIFKYSQSCFNRTWAVFKQSQPCLNKTRAVFK